MLDDRVTGPVPEFVTLGRSSTDIVAHLALVGDKPTGVDGVTSWQRWHDGVHNDGIAEPKPILHVWVVVDVDKPNDMVLVKAIRFCLNSKIFCIIIQALAIETRLPGLSS